MKDNFFRQNLISFIVGVIFAVGLAVSGMTQPQKVIAFLSPWSTDHWIWDPSLAFVMVGAIAVHALAYPLIRRRSSPVLDIDWHVPTRQDLTGRLILGSVIFGIGWGLGGFCPGPDLASLTSGDLRPVIFFAMMLLGIFLFKKTEPLLRLKK